MNVGDNYRLVGIMWPPSMLGKVFVVLECNIRDGYGWIEGEWIVSENADRSHGFEVEQVDG